MPSTPILLLSTLLCLLATPILSSPAKCADLNALHELKLASAFKNTIQAYYTLPGNKLYLATQDVTFSDWSESSEFYKGHFTEANGGDDQFTHIFSAKTNLIKDFVVFDKDELFCSASVDLEANHTLSLLTYGKRVPMPYPVEQENVYDANGDVVETRRITRNVLEDFTYQASRKQIQLGKITPNTTQPEDVDGTLAILLFNEGSLKLSCGVMRGEGKDEKLHPSLTYEWTRLVVPKVQGYDIDARTYDSILHVNREAQELLVVVTLDRVQKAAFEAEFPHVELAFNNMLRAPFVLRFSAKTGNLLSAINTIEASFSDELTVHVSSVDVRAGKILVVGNQFPSDGLYFDRIAIGAFYSVLDLSTGAASTRLLNSLLYGDDAKHGFAVRAATFAPDSHSTDLFFFAGDLQKDEKNLYDVEGRIFLSDGKSSLQQVVVGESGSNVVRSMRRYTSAPESGDDKTPHESVIVEMYMDGPTDEPEHPDDPQKDPFRKVNAGFWQVDCSSPDHVMETAAYISFFTIVSTGLMVFIAAVSGFSVLCFFQEREKREKRRALDERSRLIVNRVNA